MNLALLALSAGYLGPSSQVSVELETLYSTFSMTLLLVALLARIDGNNHLGHESYLQMRRKFYRKSDLQGQMQQALMKNLILKEAYFSFSIYIIVLALTVSLPPFITS